MLEGVTEGQETDGSVFLVEDDGLLRESLGEQLRRVGWRVEGFASAEDAWWALMRPGSSKPDVLVVDEGLPGMTGTSLLGVAWAQGYRGGRVIITGLAPECVGPHAAQCADELLTKPCRSREIMEAVAAARLVGGRRALWSRGRTLRPGPWLAGVEFPVWGLSLLDPHGRIHGDARRALAHRLSGLSVRETGAAMGGLSRSTVSALCKQAHDIIGSDSMTDLFRVFTQRFRDNCKK